MPALFMFTARWVNARKRRLREHHFKDVLGVDCPWIRLSFIEAAYSGDPKETFIQYFDKSHIDSLMKPALQPVRALATHILKRFM